MNSYDLGGHSGCGIFLIEEDDGGVFVRKVSRDKGYNDRLRAQCEKQASFVGGSIRAPRVLNSGLSESGLFFFDMEYISGITLAEYIKTMEIGKVRGLVKSLVDFIVVDDDAVCPLDNEEISVVFNNKIADLRFKLKDKNNPIIQESLDLLESHDWSLFVPSSCHGDMTLENIIVKDENLYFIDFLDSFYDSWLLDVGTLMQDVQAMWSYRNQDSANMNTILRLIVFRDLLLDAIEQKSPDYVAEVYYSLLQKLMRVYPYTTDDSTYGYLNDKTTDVLKKIYELEARRREGAK